MPRRKNAVPAADAPAKAPRKAKAVAAAQSGEPPKANSAAPTEAPLSYADRENPGKLSGDALRKLAHNRGMSRSELAAMSDDKIRMQLRYITARQGEEEMA